MNFNDSLTKYIIENITEEIYQRGLKYFSQGRVDKIRELDKRLIAIVHGSKDYLAEFRQGPKYIKGYCDCPYFESNKDYCKHIAAVAIARDSIHNFALPSNEEIQSSTIQIDRDFGNKIDQMFEEPLKADLKLLAAASDYRSWVRQHAKIPLDSTIQFVSLPLTKKVVVKGLNDIAKLTSKRNFDPYFCAGEISAVFAKNLDAIIFRLPFTSLNECQKIFMQCVIFYYEHYLNLIDGSDGVWSVPQARLPAIFQVIKQKGLTLADSNLIHKDLNQEIDGWGDIYDDLGLKNQH